MKLQKLFIAALSVSALLLPVMGFAGALDRGPMQQRYNQAADEMIRVPGTVGMYEQDAMAVLQQSGVAPNIEYAKKYKEDLVGREGTVIDQEPGAGGITMLGSTVTITVYWPPAAGDLPSDNGQYGDTGQGQREEPAADGPPPNYREEPAPQWGGGSQPGNSGGWTPPPAPAPAPQPARAVPTPQAPIKGTPVQQTATPVAPRPPVPAATPVQQQLDEKVPARIDIRNKMKGIDRKIPSSAGTPVKMTGSKPTSGPVTIQATPVQPSATQVNQQPSAPAPIVMTPAQQTVTPVSQGALTTQPQSNGTQQTQQDNGSCRSWYAIALDISAEAKRIATELGCAAVEPEPLWKQCIKHIDDIGQWAYFSVHLKKRWNRLVKKTSWAAIGPRDLTFGKTHKGRIFGTTGRMFITPVPINKGLVNIKLAKKAGKSRTSVTVCSYMPGGDRIKEWQFESPRGNGNNGQVWSKDLSNMDGKLLSIHLDGKSTADTFKYSIFLDNN